MESMFGKCISLSSFPDLSNWNINNTSKKKKIFNKCISCLIIPNIKENEEDEHINEGDEDSGEYSYEEEN